ncbi:MAG: protein translocase subunit SecD, partial [Synechococcaceae bacterium WB9_4xC_028]|nr:protein translocase subunit SecD [Synechococcaceae bacterium WB9_4xC_028]
MARQQGWFALILALAIAAASVLASFPLQLGLDLRGGSQLTLEVQPGGEIKTVKPEQLEAVKAVLDRRVNGLGVSESTLQTIGDDQLVLQLPGETDPSRAAKVLGSTALLEFRAQRPGTEEDMRGLLKLRAQTKAILAARQARAESAQPSQQNEDLDLEQLAKAQKALGLSGSAGSEQQQLEQLLEKVNQEIVARFEPAALTGKDLVTAGRQQQPNTPGWEVTLSFNREGGDAFA